MILIALYAIIFCIAIGMYQILISKNLAIKIISFNYISNIIIVLIAILSMMDGRASYIDIALIYALIGPLSTLIIVKYLRGEK